MLPDDNKPGSKPQRVGGEASQQVITESTTDVPITKFSGYRNTARRATSHGYRMFAGLLPSLLGVTRDQSDRPVDLGSLDRVSRQSLSVDEECDLCNSKYKDGRFTDTGMPPIVLTLCKYSFHQSYHVIWTFNTKRNERNCPTCWRSLHY